MKRYTGSSWGFVSYSSSRSISCILLLTTMEILPDLLNWMQNNDGCLTYLSSGAEPTSSFRRPIPFSIKEKRVNSTSTSTVELTLGIYNKNLIPSYHNWPLHLSLICVILPLQKKLVCSLGQVVKTSPSHGGIRGSTPLGSTNWKHLKFQRFQVFLILKTTSLTSPFYPVLPVRTGKNVGKK